VFYFLNGFIYLFPLFNNLWTALGLSTSQIATVGSLITFGLGASQCGYGILYAHPKFRRVRDQVVTGLSAVLLVVSTVWLFTITKYESGEFPAPDNAFSLLCVVYLLFGAGCGGQLSHSCWILRDAFAGPNAKAAIASQTLTFGLGSTILSLIFSFVNASTRTVFLSQMVLFLCGVVRFWIMREEQGKPEDQREHDVENQQAVVSRQIKTMHTVILDDSEEELESPQPDSLEKKESGNFQSHMVALGCSGFVWCIWIGVAVEIGIGTVFNSVLGDVASLFEEGMSTGSESSGDERELVYAFLVSQSVGRALALAALFSPLKKRNPEIYGMGVSLLLTLAGLVAATVTESRDVFVVAAVLVGIGWGICWGVFPVLGSLHFPNSKTKGSMNFGVLMLGAGVGGLIISALFNIGQADTLPTKLVQTYGEAYGTSMAISAGACAFGLVGAIAIPFLQPEVTEKGAIKPSGSSIRG
jgi:hypothetical protein